MVKVPIPLEEAMSNPNISISSSPFAPGKMIIKRASFKAGETPDHLKQYQISKGTGKGMTGTVVYKGKPVPKTAMNVAKKYR